MIYYHIIPKTLFRLKKIRYINRMVHGKLVVGHIYIRKECIVTSKTKKSWRPVIQFQLIFETGVSIKRIQKICCTNLQLD